MKRALNYYITLYQNMTFSIKRQFISKASSSDFFFQTFDNHCHCPMGAEESYLQGSVNSFIIT